MSWEYWPVYISNIPVALFWLIHAVRARDLFFFSAVNPSISTGGFFGEEKHKIYDLIPTEFLPKMVFIAGTTARSNIPSMIGNAGLCYPLVCKPDIGERGRHVQVIHNPEALLTYVRKMEGGLIVQEYIDLPLELSIMCYQYPQSNRSAVTSICRKVFLHVTGDGQSTLGQLIDKDPRAILQKQKLSKRMDLDAVPADGKHVLLEAIGNHCRGTQFLNANDWITPKLEEVLLSVLSRMQGVCYGRFDLRTASIEDLNAGRNFLIMEFNGVGSEPAHIYDPSYSVWRAYRDMWKHWRVLYEISREQKANGITSTPWRQGFESLRAYFTNKKKTNLTYGL